MELPPVIVVILILFGFVGHAIRPGVGFALGLLLGPFGWLIAAAMRAGDPQKPQSQPQYRPVIIPATAPPPASPFVTQQIPPPPRAKNPRLKIARDGAELGEWPESEVAGYLKSGQLEGTDYYFDRDAGEWLELVAHPKLNTP
ncbi:MAG: hypothetical protein EON58_03990 [Alphaproteobacteria bacterium]|nr:MAG: hypothetical protein EON58_03990 [Alphaproteobacteria bacterium]